MAANDWNISSHASRRHLERFGEQDLVVLLHEAKRASPQQIKRIKRNCPGAGQVYMRGFNGRYFLISHNRYVFVIEPPYTVITCWDWYGELSLDTEDLNRIEKRKPKNGSICLNEREFFGLINLARNSLNR